MTGATPGPRNKVPVIERPTLRENRDVVHTQFSSMPQGLPLRLCIAQMIDPIHTGPFAHGKPP